MPNKDVPGKIVLQQNKILLREDLEENSIKTTTVRIDREIDDVLFEVDHALRNAGLTSRPSIQRKFFTGILLYKLALDCIDIDRLIGKNEEEIEKEIYCFCKAKLCL